MILGLADLHSPYYEQYYAHAKAVLNSFNELLSEQRPFYREESPPYSWSVALPPKTVTPYTCRHVFRKARQQVLRVAGFLGGLHLVEKRQNEMDGIEVTAYKQELLAKKRAIHFERVLRSFAEDVEYKFYFWEDEWTDALMDVADEIFD